VLIHEPPPAHQAPLQVPAPPLVQTRSGRIVRPRNRLDL
jgi:hypothetical protein